MKRKNKKERMKKKLKKVVIIATLAFIGGGIFFNSRFYTASQEEVYSTLKEKYGIAVVQTTPDIISDAISEKTSENQIQKNLTLSVNSDLRVASNVTSEEIDKMLEGTKLHGLGSAFVEAEQKYGVNALYMMGLACLESGFGNSAFAQKRNNLYGWNAVDSNPNNASTFSSQKEATLYVASKLQSNYLTEGGVYYEGYSPRAVDVHYCTDKAHADKIVNIVNNLLQKLG